MQSTKHPRLVRLLPLILHMWSRPANIDGDVGMVESEEQEMHRRRYESQTAVRAYICSTKKKPKKPKFWELHEPEAQPSCSVK